MKHSRRATFNLTTESGEVITVKYPSGVHLTRDDIKRFETAMSRIARTMRVECRELSR